VLAFDAVLALSLVLELAFVLTFELTFELIFGFINDGLYCRGGRAGSLRF
jgi:hypothetical protein